MFGLGTGELVLIFLVIFLLYGPKKLPELAQSLGKVARDLRKAGDEVRDAISQEETKIRKAITPPPETEKTKEEKKEPSK